METKGVNNPVLPEMTDRERQLMGVIAKLTRQLNQCQPKSNIPNTPSQPTQPNQSSQVPQTANTVPNQVNQSNVQSQALVPVQQTPPTQVANTDGINPTPDVINTDGSDDLISIFGFTINKYMFYLIIGIIILVGVGYFAYKWYFANKPEDEDDESDEEDEDEEENDDDHEEPEKGTRDEKRKK